MANRTVSRWAPIAARASRRYHIPISVLLGEIQIESGGREGLTSSANAKGLTQFIPGTARAYHVNTSPGHAKSQIFGQAHYLHDLRRQHGGSLRAALQAYSGGSSSYPGIVLAAARGYKGVARRASRRVGGTSGGSRGFAVGSSSVTVQPHQIPDAATNLASLLSTSQPQPPSVTAPPEPTFSARNRLALPQGYGGAIQNPSVVPQQASLADQLKQVQSLAGPSIQHPSVTVNTTAVGVSGGKVRTGPGGVPQGARHLKGVAHFEGTPVAGWIKPWLQYARKHGWKGTVRSGYRSFADQKRIYNSGVRPAALPGHSNHEGANFPRGAVDVTDAAQLSHILRRAHAPLKWAGSKDPVHFSHPHGGSY